MGVARPSQWSIVAVTALLVGSCSDEPKRKPSVSTAAATLPASSSIVSSIIDVQPITISFRGQPIARLFADGRTESVGPLAPGDGVPMQPGPTLHADGTMVMTKGGVTARLDSHGDIYVVAPSGTTPRERLFGRIEGDRMIADGSSKPWNVRVVGNLIEFGEQNSSQIDGDVTPSMRHTALVMATAFSIDGALSARAPDAGG